MELVCGNVVLAGWVKHTHLRSHSRHAAERRRRAHHRVRAIRTGRAVGPQGRHHRHRRNSRSRCQRGRSPAKYYRGRSRPRRGRGGNADHGRGNDDARAAAQSTTSAAGIFGIRSSRRRLQLGRLYAAFFGVSVSVGFCFFTTLGCFRFRSTRTMEASRSCILFSPRLIVIPLPLVILFACLFCCRACVCVKMTKISSQRTNERQHRQRTKQVSSRGYG